MGNSTRQYKKEETQMRYCKRCVMPDTRPNIVFNAEGICQACLNYDRRQAIDWDRRFDELKAVNRQRKDEK